MAAAEKQRELTEHLNRIIEDGAGLEDILLALDATGALNDDEQTTDDMERPAVETPALPRGYWNIRDASDGDEKRARDLAEWACRKHQEAEDELAAIQEAADLQIAQVKAWAQEQAAKHQRRAEWMEGVLDLYQQDFAPTEKTTKLVAGKIERRKRPDVLVRDDEKALEWALQQDNVDELAPRKLSLSALNSALNEQPDGTFADADGEVVPWQHKQPNQIPYSLTVKH